MCHLIVSYSVSNSTIAQSLLLELGDYVIVSFLRFADVDTVPRHHIVPVYAGMEATEFIFRSYERHDGIKVIKPLKEAKNKV